MPKKIGQGAYLRTLGSSKYRPPKNGLMTTTGRALYHETDLPLSRPCGMVILLDIRCVVLCLRCSSDYLHVKSPASQNSTQKILYETLKLS